MKTTKSYPNEWAYDCPHCGHTQGYTNYGYDPEDYTQVHTCDKCKKEFMLELKD